MRGKGAAGIRAASHKLMKPSGHPCPEVINDRDEKRFLGGEVSEHRPMRHARARRNVLRGGCADSFFREQRRRRLKELEAGGFLSLLALSLFH